MQNEWERQEGKIANFHLFDFEREARKNKHEKTSRISLAKFIVPMICVDLNGYIWPFKNTIDCFLNTMISIAQNIIKRKKPNSNELYDLEIDH